MYPLYCFQHRIFLHIGIRAPPLRSDTWPKFSQGFCSAARFIFENSTLHPNFDVQHVITFLVTALPRHHSESLHNYSSTP